MGVTAEVTAIAVAVGAGSAATAVWSARRTEASAVSIVVRTALVGAALTVLGLATVLITLPLGAFALAHLLYLVVVVAVPMVGLALVGLAARSWPGRRVLAVVAVPLLLLAPVGIWSTHVAPYRLREDRVQLELGPGRALARPLRIGVLSDLQTNRVTGYEHRAVDRLLEQEPDVILIAGDLFQGNAEQFREQLPAYRALLQRLDAPGGVFVVPGDVDGQEGFDQLVEGTGVIALRDEVVTTEVEGQRLVIGGVRLAYDVPSAEAVYDELEATAGTDPVILMSHRPDAVLELAADSRVDLTVAGHTHGGQIALPLLGPPITLSEVPREVGAGGLHEVRGNAIYVSTGVGLERNDAPQIRFLTRPSYGIVEVAAPPA